jgi:1-phosphofructokinase
MPRPPRALVFSPSPLLTVTVEHVREGGEVHLHPGGQGFWIARMMAELGVWVRVCGTFGGETGSVVRRLMEDSGVDVHCVDAAGGNGAYVHDRRDGRRHVVAEMRPAPLSRHELDQLYGAALLDGLEADVCVLGGPPSEDVLPADVYRRLSTDLSANGRPVVADLAGEPLRAVLAGRLTALKVSSDDLQRDGYIDHDTAEEVLAAMPGFTGNGTHATVVSRAAEPVLALIDDHLFEVQAPAVEALDTSGAGDALTAGLAVELARGGSVVDGLRLGAAAGRLNVTRRGLGTGSRAEIERLVRHTTVRELDRIQGR